MTSGEQPITNSASGGGAVNRIIEVECKDKIFTNAREVADTVRDHYGFAGRIFVERLQEEGGIEEARYTFNAYKGAFEKENTTEKQALAISLILTADELISRWIFKDDHSIKVSEVPDFLQTRESVSVNARAYDYMCEFIISNMNKFSGFSDQADVWGDSDSDFMYIIRSRFNQICNDAGYNPASFLSWLKQNGKIECTGRAFTKTRRVNGEPVHCVWIKKPEVTFEDMADDEQIPFVKKIVVQLCNMCNRFNDPSIKANYSYSLSSRVEKIYGFLLHSCTKPAKHWHIKKKTCNKVLHNVAHVAQYEVIMSNISNRIAEMITIKDILHKYGIAPESITNPMPFTQRKR